MLCVRRSSTLGLAMYLLNLCQVMARGTIEDVVTTQRQYSWEEFRKAYLCAPPGLFSKRAWVLGIDAAG
jgi:hypothetical protein